MRKWFAILLALALLTSGAGVASARLAGSSPPAPRVTSLAGSVVAGRGSYCWTSPAGVGICADSVGPVTSARPLAVRPGESLRVDLRIAARSLTASLVPRHGRGEVRLRARARDRSKRRWRVALPDHLRPGRLLALFATYAGGDGSFGVTLARARG